MSYCSELDTRTVVEMGNGDDAWGMVIFLRGKGDSQVGMGYVIWCKRTFYTILEVSIETVVEPVELLNKFELLLC